MRELYDQYTKKKKRLIAAAGICVWCVTRWNNQRHKWSVYKLFAIKITFQ